MTSTAFLKHLLFGFTLSLFSVFLCWKLIQRSRILDTPNHRSSHTIPTPTAGGLAIVATFFIGMAIIYFVADETMITQKFFIGFTFSSLLIAGISF